MVNFDRKVIIPVVIVILFVLFLLYVSSNSSPNNSGKSNSTNGNYTNASGTETKNITIYNFSSQGCSACSNFKGDWDDIVKFYSNQPQIQLVEINVEKLENQPLITKYRVTHTPTIVIKTSQKEYEYRGPRNSFDIIEHVNAISI